MVFGGLVVIKKLFEVRIDSIPLVLNIIPFLGILFLISFLNSLAILFHHITTCTCALKYPSILFELHVQRVCILSMPSLPLDPNCRAYVALALILLLPILCLHYLHFSLLCFHYLHLSFLLVTLLHCLHALTNNCAFPF